MGEIVLFTVYFIAVLAITILCICERWPLLSAVSGFLLGIFSLCLLAFSAGENIDYNCAIIKLPNGSIIEGNLDRYDYSNGRMRVTIDGAFYEVDSDKCALFVR